MARDYFATHPKARERLEDYLAYGYLEINEYLRDPRAYRRKHGAGAAADVGRRARALVRDLRQAKTKRAAHLCRAQVLTNAQALRMLASRRLRSGGPLYVTRDREVCARAKRTLTAERGPDEQAAHMDLAADVVDVSAFGRRRKGEALIPPGELAIERATVAKDGTIRVRAREAKKKPRRPKTTRPNEYRGETHEEFMRRMRRRARA